MRTAAFFDVDRTLLRGSSLLHVAMPMRREGLLSTRGLVRSLLVQARFSLFGFDETQIREAVRGAGFLVAGVESARLLRFAEREIPVHVIPRVYLEARRRIEWHRAQGHLVFLVSSSPREFITVLGNLLGVDGVAATEAETIDGRCTGRILRLCHGDDKAASIRELAADHGVDLGRSYAYGDSHASDRAMLESVGHPVCVNPDRALLVLARWRGWPVERFQGVVARRVTRVGQGIHRTTRRSAGPHGHVEQPGPLREL